MRRGTYLQGVRKKGPLHGASFPCMSCMGWLHRVAVKMWALLTKKYRRKRKIYIGIVRFRHRRPKLRRVFVRVFFFLMHVSAGANMSGEGEAHAYLFGRSGGSGRRRGRIGGWHNGCGKKISVQRTKIAVCSWAGNVLPEWGCQTQDSGKLFDWLKVEEGKLSHLEKSVVEGKELSVEKWRRDVQRGEN